MFARIDDVAIIKYPYTLDNLRRDNPDEDFPDDYDLGEAHEFGVVRVEDLPQPEIGEGQTLDTDLPHCVNGVWLQTWLVHDWLTIEPDGLYARIDGETIHYPYTAFDLRRDFDIIARDGAIKQMDGEWGVVPVEQVEAPAVAVNRMAANLPGGAGIEEYEPGQWRQLWTVRNRTSDELEVAKEAKRGDLSASYTARLYLGWTHDFGAAGVHTLDLRPDKDDKANWTLLLLKTEKMITAGGGELPVKIRTSLNASIEVTAIEANAAMIAFLAWGEALFDHKWALDDDIQAVETFADLAAIDLSWPE
jgi:hypothetical protein